MLDNYDIWLRHEAELDRLRERLPVCRCCGDPIEDIHYYNVDGTVLCEYCLNEKYRRSTEEDWYV